MDVLKFRRFQDLVPRIGTQGTRAIASPAFIEKKNLLGPTCFKRIANHGYITLCGSAWNPKIERYM